MKKAILLLLVAVAFCSSCKKEQKKGPATPPKTYKVNFNVSDFTQTLAGNSANNLQTDGLKTNVAPPLSSFIDGIYCFVYNSSGKALHYFFQPSSATNFGSITDALPAGNYTFAFAAGKTGLKIGPAPDLGSGSPPTNPFTYSYLAGYGTQNPALPWQDTFFKKISLTVGGADITQSVPMDRIVSQLTVNVEDALPANAYSIKITARSYLIYLFSTASITLDDRFPPVDNFVYTTVIPASAIGTTNYKASILTLNTTVPSTVVIACYDSAGHILASVGVNNVVVHPNTQTILSGRLFGVDNQFGITANAKWDPSTINISF